VGIWRTRAAAVLSKTKSDCPSQSRTLDFIILLSSRTALKERGTTVVVPFDFHRARLSKPLRLNCAYAKAQTASHRETNRGHSHPGSVRTMQRAISRRIGDRW
jgi:hypothetical protein